MLGGKIKTAISATVHRNEVLIEGYTDKIEALSPVNVLRRGYSAVTLNGKAVNSVDDISVGGTVEILMSDGTARAMITETEKSNEVHIK